MASRGEITEPKEGGRRSGGRRWQQRGWKQHRAPRRDPRHATATLKRRIQRHVLVDTAADRYDARHLQVIISLVPFRFSFSALSVHVCLCVCEMCSRGKEKGREREMWIEEEEEAIFLKMYMCVFETRYLLKDEGEIIINNKWKRFGEFNFEIGGRIG